MTPLELLQHLHAVGIRCSVDGEKLICTPGHLLTDELRGHIRQHKAWLIQIVRWRDAATEWHREFAATAPPGTGKRLAAVPGWMERLHELEQEFDAKWKAGEDCALELAAIRKHWVMEA